MKKKITPYYEVTLLLDYSITLLLGIFVKMNYKGLTNQEISYVVSLAVVFDCEKARRMFEDKYNKEPPPARTLRHWKSRFTETLSVLPRPSGSEQKEARLSDEIREEVVAAFGDDPCTSQRQVARDIGIAQFSVNKILKENDIKPYKFVSVQELLPDDLQKRIYFCNTILERNDDEHNVFVNNICFSDEATFHVNGTLNKHNRFIYGKENPKEFSEDKLIRSPSVTCWAMTSPFFGLQFRILDNTMNGERYGELLQDVVFPLLSQRQHQRKYYQQDGAPAHFHRNVKELLNQNLPNRWIGRDGAIPWPPRSPDLSVPDFFMGICSQ